MKHLKLSLLILIAAAPLVSYSQYDNSVKILGSWSCEKIQFLVPMKDSVIFLNNLKHSVISFEPGNKVTVKFQTDSSEQVFISTYTLSIDGRTLTQNKIDSKIIRLTDQEMMLKSEGMESFIAYFKKLPAPK